MDILSVLSHKNGVLNSNLNRGSNKTWLVGEYQGRKNIFEIPKYQAAREEQEIVTACKVLIQNAIVLWNYLYLSQLLANCTDDKERCEMVSMIKNCSVIIWRHINLHGEYDFKRQADNDVPFDINKILELQVA
jgi:Tn3 transposase DDE domain